MVDFTIHPNLIRATFVVALILLLAAGIYAYLFFNRPGAHADNVGQRVRYMGLFLMIFILSMITSTRLLIIYVAFLSFLGLKEFLSITPTRRADRRVLFWIYLAIPVQYFFIAMDWYPAFIAFVPAYLFVFIPFCMVVISDTDGFLQAIATLSWGTVTMIYCMGHLAYLLLLHPPYVSEVGGMGLFLFLVVLAQMSHVIQYAFGKIIDNPKLQLKITTTRNWASLIGSVCVTMLLAFLAAPYLTPLNWWQALIIGAAVAIASFIGYLTMTGIKTDLRLKDRGTMTPGHGGVMNRIDTVIYSAPVFFHVISYLMTA
ncbi:MAG: phosphatidate cytidylyltransferase [Chloroflexota bacterium]